MPTTCAPHNGEHPGPLAWQLPKATIWCCPTAWNQYYQIEVAHEMKKKRVEDLQKIA